MIAKLIELSIRNRFLVLLLTAMLVVAGIWATFHLSIDAVPDVSDVQVIITTDYPGQAPQVVEDQITYPLTTAMMGVSHAKVVRGTSMFERSFVYVIFDDTTDIYWARSRVLEYLNFVKDRLPKGVEPKLGPDATGVGWVCINTRFALATIPRITPGGCGMIWQTISGMPTPSAAPMNSRLTRVRAFDNPGMCPLTGKPLLSANQDLGSLRSLQDWYLRYQLTSVPNVAEVASIGGFVKEYQVVLKPERMLAYKLSLAAISSAIQASNNDVGGSVVEMSETEYMVRSRGYLHGLKDLADVPIGRGENGTPILLSDVASLQIAGEERRGDWRMERRRRGGGRRSHRPVWRQRLPGDQRCQGETG